MSCRASAAVLLVCFAVACGGDEATSPVTSDINGDWLFAERLESVALGLVCVDTAQVHVVQNGAAFTGSGYRFGVCYGGADPVFLDGPFDAPNGRIRGLSVSFRDEECTYSGTIAAADSALSGTVRCTIELTSISGTWHMRRADFTPPTVSATINGAGPFSHGDTLRLTIQGSDSGGLAYVGDSVSYDPAFGGGCDFVDLPPARDSAAVSGTTAQHAFSHVVPGCSAAIRVTVFATDTAGNRAETAAGPVSFVFPESQLSGSIDDSVYTLGDTVLIDLTASNTRGLGYVGYRWYNPNFAGQDSVAVTGTNVTHPFRLAIPSDAPVTQLTVRLFARHRLGWLTDLQLPYARTTDGIKLLALRLQLPSTPWDIAYAAGPDRIYLTDSTAAVREVQLDPFQAGTVYVIAQPGASLDLSPSEDSLLVALRGELNVAVVRRGGGGSTVTVPITPPNEINIYDLRRLRIAGGGRAMLGVGSGSGGYVVQLNLSDGAQSVRQDWYGYGTFERTGDRSRVLLLDNTSPVGTQLYLAASDTFLPRESGKVTLFGSLAQISGDDGATTWLARCELLTADMVPIRILTDPSISFGPSALAPDASQAYCARGDGFVEFDVVTGNRVRAVWLPSRPEYLKALPGKRVLVASGRVLYLVTLP